MNHDIDNPYMKEELETLERWYKKRLYCVEIRVKDNYTTQELRERGHTTTGDARIDRDVLNSLITVYLTLPTISEYFKNGIALRIRNPKDCAEMYRLVNAYLKKWLDYARATVAHSLIPVEELLELDALAAQLYPLAGEFIPKTPSAMKVFLNMTLNRNGLKAPEASPELRQHTCLADELLGIDGLVDMGYIEKQINAGKNSLAADPGFNLL